MLQLVFLTAIVSLTFGCDFLAQQNCFIKAGACSRDNCECYTSLATCLMGHSSCPDHNAVLASVYAEERFYCPKPIDGCDQDARDACAQGEFNHCQDEQSCACFDDREVCYLRHPECPTFRADIMGIWNKKGFVQGETCSQCAEAELMAIEQCLESVKNCADVDDHHCDCYKKQLNCFEMVDIGTCAIATKAKQSLSNSITKLCNADPCLPILATVNQCIKQAAEKDICSTINCDCLKEKEKCLTVNPEALRCSQLRPLSLALTQSMDVACVSTTTCDVAVNMELNSCVIKVTDCEGARECECNKEKQACFEDEKYKTCQATKTLLPTLQENSRCTDTCDLPSFEACVSQWQKCTENDECKCHLELVVCAEANPGCPDATSTKAASTAVLDSAKCADVNSRTTAPAGETSTPANTGSSVAEQEGTNSSASLGLTSVLVFLAASVWLWQ